MNVSGFQVAQARPGVAAVSVFTASVVTEITKIVICNTTGTAANASIYHDDNGSTFDQTTALLYAKSIPANDYLIIDAHVGSGGVSVQKSGQIAVQSGTDSALTFTLYGRTANLAEVPNV